IGDIENESADERGNDVAHIRHMNVMDKGFAHRTGTSNGKGEAETAEHNSEDVVPIKKLERVTTGSFVGIGQRAPKNRAENGHDQRCGETTGKVHASLVGAG